VFPGVTVTDTTFTVNCATFSSICATTQAWTLTNQGTIGPANFGDGVHFTAGGTVNNSGSIDGSNGIWIVGGAATVDNAAGATIHGQNGAIVIGTFSAPITGTVTNAGTITSDGQVIGLSGGGTVTNLATGIIIGHGGRAAVSAVLGTTTVTNSGYIQSNDSGYGTGVAIAGGTVTNNVGGQILGAYNAIWANGSIATNITNNGYLEASKAQGGGAAIEFDAGGSLINTGIIRSFTSNATSSDYGIYFSGAGSITNSGTIESTDGGLAIRFVGSATHTLNLDTGSVLGGNVQGGSGTDNLVLMGTGTESIAKFLGFETLSMQGSAWTLTNNGAFSTSATVQSGLLSVNGMLTSPTVTVNAGATLGGTGTIVGNVVNNGTVAPGNSIGTLNITGNYTQAAGSTLTPEVNATTSDLLHITGTATIQASAGVIVQVAPGFYTLGYRYTILTALGGVSGTYATLTDDAPFVDFQLAYDPTNVYLDVILSGLPFAQVAQTPNEKAAAGGLQSLGAGNPVFNAAIMLSTPDALRAFDLLSGEIHASMVGTLLDESRFIRDSILGRLHQSFGGPGSPFAPQIAMVNFGADALAYASEGHKRQPGIDRALAARADAGPSYAVWAQAFGDWGRTSGDGNAATLARKSGGFIAGLDTTMGDPRSDAWRFGLAGGYQRTSLEVGDRSSSGSIDSYNLAAYAATQHGPLGLRFGSAYSWHDLAASRTIVFPGFSDATSASYDAHTAQAFGEIGYDVTWQKFVLEPFAGIAFVDVHTDGFTEGGGPASLTGASANSDTTFSTFGARAAAPLPGMAGLTVSGSLAWRHAFVTVTPTTQLVFASGGTPFNIAGVPIAKDAAEIEIGLDGQIARQATLGVAYTGQLAAHAQDHAIKASFVQRF
jgi:outer membrane autotransporter protein